MAMTMVEESVAATVVRLGLMDEDAVESERPRARDLALPLLEHLVNVGRISSRDAARVGAELVQRPFVDLVGHPVTREAVDLVPAEDARRLGVLPLRLDSGYLVVAVTAGRATDPDLETDLQAITQYPIMFEIADRDALAARTHQVHRAEKMLEEIGRTQAKDTDTVEIQRSDDDIADDQESAAALKYVETTLQGAIADRASDIHLDPLAEGAVRVRYRVDGVLRDVNRITDPHLAKAVVQVFKIRSAVDISNEFISHDGRMTVTSREGGRRRSIDVRVLTIPTINGEKIVMRLLDTGDAPKTLDELMFSQKNREIYEHSIKRPSGLVLIAGPNGAGKTSTAYVALNELNDPSLNIMTIEDPVERQLPGVNHCEVNDDRGFTYASFLHSQVRSDVNIVYCGEIRGDEEASAALSLSMTGPRVFSTLHAPDAPSIVVRLLGMGGVEPFQIASSLQCVVAQRLVRRLCEACKKPAELPGDDPIVVHHLGAAHDEAIPAYSPGGCEHCNYIGYRGRMGVHEVMEINKPVRDLIMRSVSVAEMYAAALENGMVPMHVDGFEKVMQGLTSVEEIHRVLGSN